MTEHPGVVERLRTRYGWLDHVLRANQRYEDGRGNFFAAGLSYYTVFALFPLLMVGFSVAGFLLSRQPDMLHGIEHRIKVSVPGEFGGQLTKLVDSAVKSRTSVGVVGLAGSGWVGLTWIANVREALSEMWDQGSKKPGFLHSMRSDLVAMVSAFAAMFATIALTTLGDTKVMTGTLRWLGIPEFAMLGAVLQAASLAMSLLVSWLLFTWLIARLPRERVSFDRATQAGAIAAVGFELFKQAGAVYLQSVVNGPAGVVFGPVLGLLVFAYITARLLLFATAWAATTVGDEAERGGLPVSPVPPAPPSSPAG